MLVALAVSLVCSVLVAASAVSLKPRQEANELTFRQRNILVAAHIYDPQRSVAEQFERIDARVIDLATGQYVDDVDPNTFDAMEAARDPQRSIGLDPAQDIAKLKRRESYATVYLLREGETLKTIILPIRGYGLWSTMHGFIALEPDGNTIAGLSFYEHAETPGLGDKIEDPAWQKLWEGRPVFADGDEPAIRVVRGDANPSDPFAIDGLAGATLTGRGVTNMIHFWLGEQGFGPYLRRFRKEEQST
jgi:Na+-transporting NADH:ubiquinone oxidoreductase subunit C